jgi:hypothetical protein
MRREYIVGTAMNRLIGLLEVSAKRDQIFWALKGNRYSTAPPAKSGARVAFTIP